MNWRLCSCNFNFLLTVTYHFRCACDQEINLGCLIEEGNFIRGIQTITEFDCELACSKEGGCRYYTWYPGSDGFSQFCFLFTECMTLQDCPGCYKGSVDCNVPK